jgi:hypothetical protein
MVMTAPSCKPSRVQVGRDLIERGDHVLVTGTKQNAGMRGEALGPADRALLVHEHDGLMLRVDADPAGSQVVRSD